MTPIETLGLPTRAYNALEWARISTVEELCAKKRIEILALRGMGRVSFKAVLERLAAKGLMLAEDATVEQLRTECEDLRRRLLAAQERADAAEAKLRRYEGGSIAGMLDRS